MNFAKENICERNLKDVFGAYMLKDAQFDREHYDIPFVDVSENIELPKRLVPYSKIGTTNVDESVFVHFYQNDFLFDGFYGLWNSLLYDYQSKKSFSLDKISNAGGIICPDYSLYGDFPESLKIYNIYRSRAIGSYINRIGGIAIPSFHGNGPESYHYCFAGLRENTIVALSTVGCLRNNADREMFLPDTEELIKRIHPKLILLYGNLNKEVINLFGRYNQKYLFFPSDIALAHGGTCYGHESE